MIKVAYLLGAAAVLVTAIEQPRTTTVIEKNPVVYADPANNTDDPGRVILPDGTAEYTFNNEWWKDNMPRPPVLVPEDPNNFRPEPLRCDAKGADAEFCIDPAYKEPCESPGADPQRCTDIGPVDGPGEGPGTGTPADKPPP